MYRQKYIISQHRHRSYVARGRRNGVPHFATIFRKSLAEYFPAESGGLYCTYCVIKLCFFIYLPPLRSNALQGHFMLLCGWAGTKETDRAERVSGCLVAYFLSSKNIPIILNIPSINHIAQNAPANIAIGSLISFPPY